MSDINKRLESLRKRRLGLTREGGLFAEYAESQKRERYEENNETPSVKFALGSMQPVDKEYTNKCYEEGDRVKNQLLSNIRFPRIDFRYQGSVPLDVHIRANSDVDLLLFHDEFVTNTSAARGRLGPFQHYDGAPPYDELLSLRNSAFNVLQQAFPRVTVEGKSKSIRLSGGSLAREIDVITAHWHNTDEYAFNHDETLRGVNILVVDERSTASNLPFVHIERVREKCQQHNGSLRKVIRLLKNLKAQLEEEQVPFKLSSYDIAAIAWHMPAELLNVPAYYDLLLLSRIKQHLTAVIADENWRKFKRVPDDTRIIFDHKSKYSDVLRLYLEIVNLEKDIAKEVAPNINRLDVPEQVLNRKVYI